MKALGNLLIRAGKAIGGKMAFPVIEAAVAATAGVVVGVLAYHFTPAAPAPAAAEATREPEVVHEPVADRE